MTKKKNILIAIAVIFLLILIFFINRKALADEANLGGSAISGTGEDISKEEKTEADFETSVYQVEEINVSEETSLINQKEVPKAKESDETYLAAAERFIARFHEDYPGSEIVKIRWQLEPSLISTYVIEGLNPKNNKEKYVMKMLELDDIVVLGSDIEHKDDSEEAKNYISFTPLDMDGILTIDQVRAIVEENENTTIVTMSIQWQGGRQIIFVELEEKIEEGTPYRWIIVLDSKTGEILNLK